MTEPPEPPRRLEWPGLPSALGDEPEEVLDPGGNWLPEGSGAANTDDSAAKQSIFFRDDRRWAPQHGVAGRSDSALPGPFMFPEPPATEVAAEPVLETGAVASARSYSRENHFVRELVETLLLAILVFLAVRASIQHYRVEGHSMDPTLDDGEFLLVNSLVYSEVNIHSIDRWVPFWDPGGPDVRHVFHGPQRGDIVILHPQQRDDRDLVKRIIGVPGDQFEIRDGTVYINGRPLIEPYIKEPWHGDYKAVVIPAHEFFVMGDNRNGSLDSRAFGLVNEDDIIGKAMASWWPKKDWGPAPNEAPTFGPAN